MVNREVSQQKDAMIQVKAARAEGASAEVGGVAESKEQIQLEAKEKVSSQQTIPCSQCSTILVVPASLTFEWSCREPACMAARVSNDKSATHCGVCLIKRHEDAPCDNQVRCASCQATTEVPHRRESILNGAAQTTKGVFQTAVSRVQTTSLSVQRGVRHLFAPPLFVRCPHCIATLAVAPPPQAPSPHSPESGKVPAANEDEEDEEEEEDIPAALRGRIGADRRVMACPHCGGVFRIPSTVAWEQMVYIGARLRLAVVAFWDKAKNGWAYMFKKQPQQAAQQEQPERAEEKPRYRVVEAAVTSKAWTEQKIASVFELLRRKPESVPEELFDDVEMQNPPPIDDAKNVEEDEAKNLWDEVQREVEKPEPEPQQVQPEPEPEPEPEAQPEAQPEVQPEPQEEPQAEPEPEEPEEPGFVYVDEPSYPANLETLASMGFPDREQNLDLLKVHGLERTIELLLSNQ